jgi:hypothetical protein
MKLNLQPICPICERRVERLVPFGRGRACADCEARHHAIVEALQECSIYDGFDDAAKDDDDES